jgi:hypothetical protein
MLCFIPQKKCCLESANRFAVAINISEICRWVKSGQPLSLFYFNVFLFLCLNSIFQFSNRLDLVMSFAYHFSRAGAGGNPCSLAAVVYCCTWLYSLLWLGVFLICFLTLFRFDESVYSSCWHMPFDLDLLFTNHLLVLEFFFH